jgi:hypothetical protein
MSNLYKIHSSKRTTGSINDFTITFNQVLENGLYRLKQVCIPNSVYIVNDTNNKIYFEEFGGSILTATLTNGDYTTTTLATEVGTAMTNISASSGLTRTYTATFNTTTLKLTISSTSTFKMLMATYTTNSSSNIIGYNIDDNSFASSQISDNMVNLTNEIYSYNFYIQGQNVNNYLVDNNGITYSFSVPVSVSFGNIVSYEPLTNYYISFDTPTRVLKIQVRDDTNTLVQLNTDYYFILEFYNSR